MLDKNQHKGSFCPRLHHLLLQQWVATCVRSFSKSSTKSSSANALGGSRILVGQDPTNVGSWPTLTLQLVMYLILSWSLHPLSINNWILYGYTNYYDFVLFFNFVSFCVCADLYFDWFFLLYVACILSVCHCLFSDYARQYLLKWVAS